IRSCATTRFATSRAIVWLSTASPVFAVRVVISAPPPPLCAPPAPCPCCRVPTAPALRGARYAVTRPPPRPAPLRSAGASCPPARRTGRGRSEEHTSELQSLAYLVCRLLLEKKKQ